MKHIHYSDKGKGSPIILFHGFCETHEIWDGLSEALSDDVRVIAPDLPGFGQSDLPAGSFSIEEIGAVMTNWLAGLSLTKPILIGHSLGGYIALAMAAKNPDLFSGLGLFHSTAFADTEEKKINRNRTIDFVKNNGVGAFVEIFVPSLFYQKQHPAVSFVKKMAHSTTLDSLVAYTNAMRDRPSSEEFLRDCEINRMILAGEHDSIIPPDAADKIAKLSSKTLYRILKNTGHVGMVENLQDSLTAMREFVMLCRSQQG